MASIARHGEGWRAQVFKHGNRATKVFGTKREAQAWALKKEAELDALKGSGGKTLRQAVARYLKQLSSTKPDTKWEKNRFDQLMEFLPAETALSSIGSDEIGGWRDWLLEDVSGSTVLRYGNLYHAMFTAAVDEWKWITAHPFKGVKMPKENDARHQLWTWQLIKRILRADRGGKTAEVIRAFHISLHSTRRLKEVLTAEADIRRRVYRLKKTKTTGYVEAPIPRRAMKLLPAAFTVEPNEASTLFCRLKRELLIEDLTFHDARATACTHLARRVDVMTLARISLHKDINLLQRVYYRETAEAIAARI